MALPEVHLPEEEMLRRGSLLASKLEDYIQQIEKSSQSAIKKLFKISVYASAQNILIGQLATAKDSKNFESISNISGYFDSAITKLSEKIDTISKKNEGRPDFVRPTTGFIGKLYKDSQAPFIEIEQQLSKNPVINNSNNISFNQTRTNFNNQNSNTDNQNTSFNNPYKFTNNTSSFYNPTIVKPKNQDESTSRPVKNFINQLTSALMAAKLTVQIDESQFQLLMTQQKPLAPDLPNNPKPTESKPTLESKKQTGLLNSIAEWFKIDALRKKAKESVSAARDSLIPKPISKAIQIGKKVADLPDLIGGYITRMLGSALSTLSAGALIGAAVLKKLIFNKFTILAGVAGLLLTDTVRDVVVDGIKKIFGKDTAESFESFAKDPAFGAAIIGAGVGGKLGAMLGTMLGGPVGAIVGGLLGAAIGGVVGIMTSWYNDGKLEEKWNDLKDALGLSVGSIDKKIQDIKIKSTDLNQQINEEVNSISGIRERIANIGLETTEAEKSNLERELQSAIKRRDALRDEAKMLEYAAQRAEVDKAAIEKFGFLGEISVAINKVTQKIGDLLIYSITWVTDKLFGTGTLGSVDEMFAIIERNVSGAWGYVVDKKNKLIEYLDEKKNAAAAFFQEKIDWISGKITELIELPGKILDWVSQKISDATNKVNNFLYDNTIGFFTKKDNAPVQTTQPSQASSRTENTQLSSNAKSFNPIDAIVTSSALPRGTSPTDGVNPLTGLPTQTVPQIMLKNYDVNSNVQRLDNSVQILNEKKEKERQAGIASIIAPQISKSQTNVQNNNHSQYNIKTSPFDMGIRTKPFGAF